MRRFYEGKGRGFVPPTYTGGGHGVGSSSGDGYGAGVNFNSYFPHIGNGRQIYPYSLIQYWK